MQQEPEPSSRYHFSNRAPKNLKKRLFLAKASLPFIVVFAVVILPIAQSEGQEILQSRDTNVNSQNLKLLKSQVSPDLSKDAVGGSDIVIDENALIASNTEGEKGVAPKDSEPKKVQSSDQGNDINVYTVKAGDTLSEIAEEFGVKVSTIRGFNDIRKDSDLRVGQELLILPIDGVAYTVQKGDTISGIAKKFKSDADDIALFNDLSDKTALKAGDEIIIPGAEPLPIEKPAEKPKVASTEKPSSSSTSSGTKSSGSYIHPVPGARKSQGFHDKYQAQDLAAPTGTKIIASSGGRVVAVRTGWSGGYGNMIIIDDGQANVLYAHMSKISVSQGQVVAQGEKIGEVGSTGRSTGPHLHIEYRGKKGPITTPVW